MRKNKNQLLRLKMLKSLLKSSRSHGDVRVVWIRERSGISVYIRYAIVNNFWGEQSKLIEEEYLGTWTAIVCPIEAWENSPTRRTRDFPTLKVASVFALFLVKPLSPNWGSRKRCVPCAQSASAHARVQKSNAAQLTFLSYLAHALWYLQSNTWSIWGATGCN